MKTKRCRKCNGNHNVQKEKLEDLTKIIFLLGSDQNKNGNNGSPYKEMWHGYQCELNI